MGGQGQPEVTDLPPPLGAAHLATPSIQLPLESHPSAPLFGGLDQDGDSANFSAMVSSLRTTSSSSKEPDPFLSSVATQQGWGDPLGCKKAESSGSFPSPSCVGEPDVHLPIALAAAGCLVPPCYMVPHRPPGGSAHQVHVGGSSTSAPPALLHP